MKRIAVLFLLLVSSCMGADVTYSRLKQLLDVTITNPLDGQLLHWDNTAARWVNFTPSYLTGNQSISISGDASGSGTTAITLAIGAGKITSSMIADGTIVDADINASAGIADTKLGTIATAGKVSNSATTAASANTASAIVARDVSGNFTAGTITGALSGNATTATTLATPRAINGTNFDGSAPITVTAAAGTLTGTALNGTVVTSSLTGVGTLTSGTASTGFTIQLGNVTLSGNVPIANLAGGTGASNSTFLRGDNTWATPAGSGTVTATGGNLTANSIVLGAGTTDTKVVAGIISDGAGKLTLGVNTTTLGSIKFFGNTSGDVTVAPSAVAGTAIALTWPNHTGTLVGTGDTGSVSNGMLASSSTTINGTVISLGASGTVAAAAGTLTGATLASGVTASSLTSFGSGPAIGAATGTSLSLTSLFTTTQSIGATSTDGLLLTNTTAAALGAQQWSPRVHLAGRGWQTSGSSSVTTEFWEEVQPVQGSSAPTANWVLTSKIGGAAAAAGLTVDSAGNGTFAGTIKAGSGPTTLVDSVGKVLSASLNTVAVANGGTGLTSGTSGGVLAYTATGTLASSGALAANALVIGGGAGVAPSTTATGTGVLTALGVNVGSAGAFVAFNGALGTPSSGTLTSATGLPVSTGISGLGTTVATNLAKAADGSVVDAIGFRGIPQNSQSIAYTTVMADAGKHLFHPAADTTARTFTIDSNANVAYPVGTALTFINETLAGVITIAITSDTLLHAADGTTGSYTLAASKMATAIKITSTKWIISP